MSVLTNLTAVPNRIAIGCEYLQIVGRGGVERSTLEKHLSPLGTKGKNEDGESTGKPIARDILKELEALKLAVDVGDDKIALNEDLPQKQKNANEWADCLLPRLLEIFVDERLAEDHGQKEVPETLAWLLAQNSLRAMRLSGEHAALLDKQFKKGEQGALNFSNDQRFQNLVYWAKYLGFVELQNLSGDIVISDPARAIEVVLPRVFENDVELSIGRFVERLGRILPVMEKGTVRTRVEERMLPEYARETPTFFSTSTALAIRRLELREVLQSEMKSDAAEVWVLPAGAGKTSRISHVRIKKAG
jgi:hypothetical protein